MSQSRCAIIVAIVVTLCSFAAEAGVIVSYDPGTTYTTTALTGYQTLGNMMAGMQLNAYFSNNSSQSVPWIASGPSSGGATGTGWSLALTGDTFGAQWNLHNSGLPGLTRLMIDAGAGNTVFDVWSGDYGTPGSFNGWPFSLQSATNPNINITATYRDLIALTGFDPVGDLYRLLDIRFTDVGGLLSGQSIAFISDTDNIASPGDLHPTPEPMSLLIWLLSLSLVAGVARWGRSGASRKAVTNS